MNIILAQILCLVCKNGNLTINRDEKKIYGDGSLDIVE